MRTKGIYNGEHLFAWLLVAVAVVLGVIGALVAYNVFDLRSIQDMQDGGLSGGAGSRAQDFQDGALLILPAIIMAFLAYTLHGSQRFLAPGETRAVKRWRMEHSASYVVAIGTLFLAIAGMVIGFDIWDEGWLWTDGVVLQLLGLGAVFLTAMLHAVGHYSAAPMEDDIRILVEDRVSQTLQRAGSAVSERAPERRA